MSDTTLYKGYTIEAIQDQDPQNPREDDNLGTMVCFSRRHTLGDETEYANKPNEFREYLHANEDNVIMLPLFLYDHSGITMSTSDASYPFNDQWDAGQVGMIYVTKEKARKELGWKVLTKARIEKIKEYLRGEVETYDQYLTGAVYGYQVKSPDGSDVDDGSCWGFFGNDHEKSGLLEQARNAVDCEVKRVLKEEGVQETLKLDNRAANAAEALAQLT